MERETAASERRSASSMARNWRGRRSCQSHASAEGSTREKPRHAAPRFESF